MTINRDSALSSETNLQHGIAFMIVGTLIVPVMDAMAKYLGDSLSPVQITWGRFLFQCLILGGVLIATSGWRSISTTTQPAVHTLRGMLLATATVLFFWSLKYLPLADAIALFFVQPMILTLMSAAFLGESIGWHRRVAVCVGFLGAMLIIRPGSDSFSIASTLPLGAALFFASYMTLTRAYANCDSAVTMQFTSGISATVVLSAILGVAHWGQIDYLQPSVPTTSEWFFLAMIGVVSTAGHLLIVMAMNRAPASLLAPFGYVEIIAATLLGWFVFQEWPDNLTWAGILIIVSSGFYVFERERRLAIDDS